MTEGVEMTRKHLSRMTKVSTFLIIFIIILLGSSLPLSAKVTGVCYNCHTMHNSQDGSAVVLGGTGVGWDGSGNLIGGTPSETPMDYLLITTCVGCHTSTTSSTIINTGGSSIPIVYNTTQPTTPLAGGNFYWVATDDTKGHNVYGIASQDSNLSEAPGFNVSACGNTSCHVTLASAPVSDNYYRGGCQGCHVFTYHHEDNEVYRFLKGHGFPPPMTLTSARKDITNYPDYVEGIEDNDWEYSKSSTDHNFYKGTNVSYVSDGTGLPNQHSITAFCAGCHRVFHEDAGSESPWLRHPNDIVLPTTGEYGAYDPTTNYSTEAPVAWLNPATPATGEAIVMCLSCHRPHGSNQPDMLRWDYSTMIAGGGGSGGCFTCHTTKNQ